MFSLCIPTMDRFDTFLSQSLPLYLKNDLISEIIIGDENGNDVDKINIHYPGNAKLKLFKNEKRLGPFLNKISVCKKAENEWIVLIDSDNFATKSYFETAKSHIEQHIREKNIILAPVRAQPHFNYSHLGGLIFKKGNFNSIKVIENNNRVEFRQSSEVLMNTGNYVLNKYLIDNLNLDAETNNIPYSSACDVIYFNTLLFEQLDLNMHILPELEYSHVVHEGSTYSTTCNEFRNFNEYVYNRYRNLL
jgi:hypothetical protein